MNYEFSINRTGVVSITVGSVVIGVLLFAAGLVVGSQWLITTAASAPSTTARNEQAEPPQEPVLKDEPKTARPKPAPPTPKETEARAPEAAKVPEANAQAAIPPPLDDQIQIIQEAAADPASSENAAAEPEYVTVQVGVFLDENEANRLLKQIERKGYAPSFFSGRDAEAREWYAVRIGAYSDKQQAANAAANFTKQEKMRAVVRPLGSL